jgi:hypothetical protein
MPAAVVGEMVGRRFGGKVDEGERVGTSKDGGSEGFLVLVTTSTDSEFSTSDDNEEELEE